MDVHNKDDILITKSSPLVPCTEFFCEEVEEYSSPCLDVINTPPHADEAQNNISNYNQDNRGFSLNSNGCDSGIIQDIMDTPPPPIKLDTESDCQSQEVPVLSHHSLYHPSSYSSFISSSTPVIHATGYPNTQHTQHLTSSGGQHTASTTITPTGSNLSNYHPCNTCPLYEPCLCFMYNAGYTATNSGSANSYDLAAAAMAAQSQHNFHHYHHQSQPSNLLSSAYHSHHNPLDLAAAYSLYQNLPTSTALASRVAPSGVSAAASGVNCQQSSVLFPGGYSIGDYGPFDYSSGIEVPGSGQIEAEVLDSTVHSTMTGLEAETNKQEVFSENDQGRNCLEKSFMNETKSNGRLIGPKNKPLNEIAVRLMESWYSNHEDHPYPSYNEKEQLAMGGSITVAQVNSWFANRRNRSDNTKPKKNKKQLEIRLVQFGMELETATNGCLNGCDLARRIIRIIDEFLV